MNKKYLSIGLILLLVVGSIGIFFTVAHPLATLQPRPTPIPYKAPPRTIEVPLTLHRAQSTTINQTIMTFNPWGIALDQQNGYVWVAETGCEMSPVCTTPSATKIGKFSLADGSLLQEYQEPPNYSNPLFVAVDANGDVWFTEPATNAIGEFNPNTTVFTQYPTSKGSAPYDLLFDKNGNIWFTEFTGNSIGFLNTQTGAVVETPVSTVPTDPYGITIDGKGTIWFAENRKFTERLGSFTPTTSGKITIEQHNVTSLQPHLLVADKAGNIWFSEAFSGAIGEYIPSTDTTNHIIVSSLVCPVVATCTGTHISGIAVDKNGNIWFTDSLSGRVGYIVPATGALHAYTICNKEFASS